MSKAITDEMKYAAARAASSNTDDADARTVMLAVLGCAQAWVGDMRLIGNVRASDIVRALSAALSAGQAQPVASEAAQTLLDRLDEFRVNIDDIDDERSFEGHVVPAMAGLRSALVTPTAWEVERLRKALETVRANLVRLAWEENTLMIEGIDAALASASVPGEEMITIGGREYRKFIRFPEEIDDGTLRCISCGQIDEEEFHDNDLCVACPSAPVQPDTSTQLGGVKASDIVAVQDALDSMDWLGTGSDSRGADKWRIKTEASWQRIRSALNTQEVDVKGKTETLYRWRGPKGGWIYDAKKPSWHSERLEVRPALSVPLPEIEGGDIAWESPEEWAIEQRAFHAAGRDDVPADVQQLVAKLWAMYCHAAAPSASIEGGDKRDARINWDNPEDTVVKMFVKYDVEGYVEEYEFCGEGGDYSPNERERTLLVDAIYGVVANLHEELRKIIPSSPNQGETE